MTWTLIKELAAVIGFGTFLSGLFWFIVNKGWKKNRADLSKTESEAVKVALEREISKLNVTKILEERIQSRETYYQALVWDNTKRHYDEKQELRAELEACWNREREYEGKIDELHKELSEMRQQIEELNKKFSHGKK